MKVLACFFIIGYVQILETVALLLNPKHFLSDEIISNSVESGPRVRWMLIPDDNGDVQVAILSGYRPRVYATIDDVRFLLWTRESQDLAEQQTLNETCGPMFEHFLPQRPTIVMIHGFGDTVNHSIMYPLLKNAFLSTGDYNVLAVDWGKMAAAPWYHTAVSNTVLVARHTAHMIDYLIETTGASASRFHLVGFSLGAHVAGMTGQFVKKGPIRRITGLDPAQILFSAVPPEGKLDNSDGDLVEVIHTSGGYLAFIDPIGDRDFFPNGGGWPQPGCRLDFLAVCSHRRAYYYLAEAVERGAGFTSRACSDWVAFKNGLCNDSTSANLPIWSAEYDDRSKGKFFLETNSETPFSKTI